MRPTATLAPLLALFHACAASSQNETLGIFPGHENHEIVRRWYSISGPQQSTFGGDKGPWPVMCPGPHQTQPIRYCFKDARSETRLFAIVNQAVSKWAHALDPHSALTITPDSLTSSICSEHNRADALVISDETVDGDAAHNDRCITASTLGYTYASPTRGRHYIQFCSLRPGELGPAQMDEAIKVMMHELGHVMGLLHEHQRPDARSYLGYDCKNLVGYKAAIDSAVRNEKGGFGQGYTEDKILETMYVNPPPPLLPLLLCKQY